MTCFVTLISVCVGQVRNRVTSGSDAQFLYTASASYMVSLLNTNRPVSSFCVPQWFMEISLLSRNLYAAGGDDYGAVIPG